ncbi:hypothetical protein Ciccas_004246 [Cichlidogyrus casuarinus]|uniref:SCAP N-terminal domain-containing protein n=1 Tax=Cichlidogyrus casuarinus TaxID=1844966 RepID=A0ABD2QC13_9PLAT
MATPPAVAAICPIRPGPAEPAGAAGGAGRGGGGAARGGADLGGGVFPTTIPDFPFIKFQDQDCLYLSPVIESCVNEVDYTSYSKCLTQLAYTGRLRELFVGLPWRMTGIPIYSLRNRQRVMSFAVTLVLKDYDRIFLEELRHSLHSQYPYSALIEPPPNAALDLRRPFSNDSVKFDASDRYVFLVKYGDHSLFVAYAPLFLTYFSMFLYIYFSVSEC